MAHCAWHRSEVQRAEGFNRFQLQEGPGMKLTSQHIAGSQLAMANRTADLALLRQAKDAAAFPVAGGGA